MSRYDVIVIGAGPAGLLAAGRAAQLGGKVLVMEKMKQEGRKLIITGKGRCNITNDSIISEFVNHVHPDGRFLRSAFSKFYSQDIIELVKKYGLETNLERGGRYFPVTNKASDVLKALKHWVNDYNVEIRCNMKVDQLITDENRITGVKANGQVLYSSGVILATGGKSYPATGSTGDGYILAKDVGHTIAVPRPALVPLETEERIPDQLADLTLKNVNATVWINEKKAAEDFGELTFMSYGLSGPIVLTLSRKVVDALDKNQQVRIQIDLKPALDEQKLDNRLIRDLNDNGKKKLVNLFRLWLPSALIPCFISRLKVDINKECHQVSAKERKKIRNLLKNLTFNITNYRSFNEAIITAGGVSTKEIASKTMESKIVKGLFFAGEVIDVDGETGGYNLQIAYSTGWLAGESAMQQ